MDGAEARTPKFDDEATHSWQCPNVGRIPLPFGARDQRLAQTLEQTIVNRALAAEASNGRKLLRRCLGPSADRLATDIELPGHLRLRHPLVQKFLGGQPPLLQRL